jgi:hypothetical protein
MNTPQGAQIASSGLSGASVDMHADEKNAPRRGDRSWGWAGSLPQGPTDSQLLPHEGFRTGTIHTRGNPSTRLASDPPTMLLAKPPAWSEAGGRPCDPPPGLGKLEARRHMDAWDVNESRIKNGAEHAAKLCAGCPVRAACLTAALEEEGTISPSHRYLVRGGMTPKQRHHLAQLAIAPESAAS